MKNPTMSGMQQVIMSTPTAAELEASADTKERKILSGTTIKTIPNVGGAIDADSVLAEQDILRLSKNQKLQMVHNGFVESDTAWKSTPSWEKVTDDGTEMYRYVAPGEEGVDNGSSVVKGQARPTASRAETDDGIVYTENGSFTSDSGYKYTDWEGNPIEPYESYSYEGNASSSSANDGMVGPEVTSIAANAEFAEIVDLPGKIGGDEINSENAFNVSGHQVVTSKTYLSLVDKIKDIADGSIVKTSLTIDDLKNIGLPVDMIVTDNLSGYQDAIAATGDSGDVDTIQKICQIVHDVNSA